MPARAIAGGLLFSTAVTLLALPLIYSLLDDARMALCAELSATPAAAQCCTGTKRHKLECGVRYNT